jgi:type I restriction enzyme, S subunit
VTERWRDALLGDMIQLQRGFDLTEKTSAHGEIPVYSSGGLSYFTDVARCPGPGVITGRKGVLGKVHYSAGNYWPHDTTLWVKDFNGSEPRFVYYLLQTLPLASLDAGASNPTLNRNHAHLLPVRIPEPETQRAIASVLGAIDDLIENNRRRVELLEHMAQAIYREWFVHFRYPGHEFDEFVDSPLGPLPSGFSIQVLGSVARVVRGRSYRKHELVETGGVPFVNLKCMERGGGFRRDGLKRYVGVYSSDQEAKQGDIVLAVTDLTQLREVLAQATLVPRIAGGFGVISLDVIRVVPSDPSETLPLYFALRHPGFADRVKEYANGSTVLHLSPTHVAEASILWPTERLRMEFATITKSLVQMVDDLLDGSDRLTSIRDLLLPKLVTGQIDVSKLDLDSVLEGAGV